MSWFTHDSSAQFDQKILLLREKYDWYGYGMYWAILEAMHENVDAKLDAAIADALYIRVNVKKEWLQEFMQFCIHIGLFVVEDGAVFTLRLVADKKRMAEKSEQARQAVARRADRRSILRHSTDVERTYNETPTDVLPRPVPTLQTITNANRVGESAEQHEDHEFLWQEYERMSGREVRVKPKRLPHLRVALRSFSAEEIREAWAAMAVDKFLRGENRGGKDYFTIDYALRVQNIEKFLHQFSHPQ